MGTLIIGILFILGGISGQFALRGTNSPAALIVVGIILVFIGVIQIITKKEKSTDLVDEKVNNQKEQKYDDVELIKTVNKSSFKEGDIEEYHIMYKNKIYIIYCQVHTYKYYIKDEKGKNTFYNNYDECIQAIRKLET
jgi:hypothetical protein